MLSVAEQVRRGILVCPVTREKLILQDQELKTVGGTRRYSMLGDVPILLADPDTANRYVQASPRMVTEYRQTPGPFRDRIRKLLARDYRTEESLSAFEKFARNATGDSVVLSLGGGPLRAHAEFLNLNIGVFPNVDVVADAHRLPYSDESVQGIFCEAGLEHFADPDSVVAEVFRVLATGGLVYSIIPFLQAYHGYPDHFQNLTLSGHRHLFERGGFRVAEAGPCVGPLYAFFDLTTVFINEYFPKILRPIARKSWRLFGLAVGPLNRRLNCSANAHVFASTTYCLAEKPG